MVKLFKFVTPQNQSEMSLGLPFGSVTLKNHQIVPESNFTKLYSDMFIEMPSTDSETSDVQVEPITAELLNETVPTVEKRKAGRPKKSL